MPWKKEKRDPFYKFIQTLSNNNNNNTEVINGVTFDVHIKTTETKYYYLKDGQTVDQNTLKRLQELTLRPNP
jgi:mannose-1-phosphate guanylyltransferase